MTPFFLSVKFLSPLEKELMSAAQTVGFIYARANYQQRISK